MYTSLLYRTGNPNFRGETTLEVLASGQAKASFTQGENTQNYDGELNAEEITAFWAAISALNPCALMKSRPGQPGENTLDFNLETETGHCHGEAWMNDKFENPLLLAASKQISAVLGKISGGLLTQ